MSTYQWLFFTVSILYIKFWGIQCNKSWISQKFSKKSSNISHQKLINSYLYRYAAKYKISLKSINYFFKLHLPQNTSFTCILLTNASKEWDYTTGHFFNARPVITFFKYFDFNKKFVLHTQNSHHIVHAFFTGTRQKFEHVTIYCFFITYWIVTKFGYVLMY